MPYTPKHRIAEVGTSSVADIAFLLLSFFLMTTVIDSDQGLTVVLPEWHDQPIEAPVLEKNLFKIHINSNDAIMVEGKEIPSLAGLKTRIREFILNNGSNPELSENAMKAVVSLKTDRGTSHKMFMTALDEIHAAYYEIYAERAGLSVEAYRKLDVARQEDRKVIEKAKQNLPMNVSLAEPSEISSM